MKMATCKASAAIIVWCLTTTLQAMSPVDTFSDGGPLDENGCHVSLRTNEYHCHPVWRNPTPPTSHGIDTKKCPIIGIVKTKTYYRPSDDLYAKMVKKPSTLIKCFKSEAAAKAQGYKETGA